MSTSHSSSDVFLDTVREPRKQRRLEFNNAKQTFDLTQFVTTNFGRLSFSDNRSDSREQWRKCAMVCMVAAIWDISKCWGPTPLNQKSLTVLFPKNHVLEHQALLH